MDFTPLQVLLAAMFVFGALHKQLVQNVDQNLGHGASDIDTSASPTGGTVTRRTAWVVTGPSLTEAVPAKTVIAVHQHDRIHKRATADGTHEVAVVVGNVVEHSHVDGRVEVHGIATRRSLVQVVRLIHPSARFHSAHATQVAGDKKRSSDSRMERATTASWTHHVSIRCY